MDTRRFEVAPFVLHRELSKVLACLRVVYLYRGQHAHSRYSLVAHRLIDIALQSNDHETVAARHEFVNCSRLYSASTISLKLHSTQCYHDLHEEIVCTNKFPPLANQAKGIVEWEALIYKGVKVFCYALVMLWYPAVRCGLQKDRRQSVENKCSSAINTGWYEEAKGSR